MKTTYSSFAEIDRRLRILDLQMQIERESIKLHLKEARTSLYPRKPVRIVLEFLPVIIIPYIKKRWFSKRKKLKESYNGSAEIGHMP